MSRCAASPASQACATSLSTRLRLGCGASAGPSSRIAQSSDDLSHLGERLAPGLLHCEEGLAFLGLFGAEQPTHSRRLDRHDAEAVADDVVQFAGDAGAFLDDGPERVDLVFLFEPRGAFLGGVGAHASVAKREAGQPHERVQGRGDHEGVDGAPRVVRHDDRDTADRDGQPDPRPHGIDLAPQ